MERFRITLWLITVLLCLSLFAVNFQHRSDAKHPSGNKQLKQTHHFYAPHFTLHTLNGNKVSLNEYRGRFVLLNMWASWCSPCQRETPQLEKLIHLFNSNNLVVLGINMTSQETSLQQVQQFVDQHRISYPVLLDKKGKIMEHYGVKVLPTSFLIGKHGTVIRQFQGPITANQITKVLDDVK